jgi:Putative peptidoglycan binding domain
VPGHCKTLLHGPTNLSVEYYVAAYPASGVYEQEFDWPMPTSHGLCIADGHQIFFKKDDPQPCGDESLTFADWFQIVPGSEDFSFEFQSNENFALEQAQIAGAQQLLNLLGYEAGPIDGIVGTRTTRGLRLYQRDAGLRPDGRLTTELLEGMASALRRAYASKEIVLQRPTSH